MQKVGTHIASIFHFFNVCACTNWWLSLPNLFSFAMWVLALARKETTPILMSTPPGIISTPVISIWKHITHHILRHPAGKHWTPTTIHNTTYNTYGNRMTWWNRGTNCNSQLHCPCPDWVWEFPLNISPSRVQPLQDFTLTPHSDVNPPGIISTHLSFPHISSHYHSRHHYPWKIPCPFPRLGILGYSGGSCKKTLKNI